MATRPDAFLLNFKFTECYTAPERLLERQITEGRPEPTVRTEKSQNCLAFGGNSPAPWLELATRGRHTRRGHSPRWSGISPRTSSAVWRSSSPLSVVSDWSSPSAPRRPEHAASWRDFGRACKAVATHGNDRPPDHEPMGDKGRYLVEAQRDILLGRVTAKPGLV